MGEVVSDYLERGLVLVIADLLSLITVSSCLVIKVPQINTIRENESSKGESAAHAKSPKNTHLHQSLFLARHQCAGTMPGAVQLHGNAVVQLQQRL